MKYTTAMKTDCMLENNPLQNSAKLGERQDSEVDAVGKHGV